MLRTLYVIRHIVNCELKLKKFLIGKIVIVVEEIHFLNQGCIKIDQKLQTISISNKCCSFDISINLFIEKMSLCKTLSSSSAFTLILIRNSPNQHISMISEGSCGIK